MVKIGGGRREWGREERVEEKRRARRESMVKDVGGGWMSLPDILQEVTNF